MSQFRPDWPVPPSYKTSHSICIKSSDFPMSFWFITSIENLTFYIIGYFKRNTSPKEGKNKHQGKFYIYSKLKF